MLRKKPNTTSGLMDMMISQNHARNKGKKIIKNGPGETILVL